MRIKLSMAISEISLNCSLYVPFDNSSIKFANCLEVFAITDLSEL